MKKNICDTCQRKKYCNTFDSSRGIACMEYGKEQNSKNRNKEEKAQWKQSQFQSRNTHV